LDKIEFIPKKLFISGKKEMNIRAIYKERLIKFKTFL